MPRNRNEQHGSVYSLTACHPSDRSGTVVHSDRYSRAALADLLMRVEELLGQGYQVTVTPPANAPPPPAAVPGVGYLQPQHLEVVDVEIIA